MGVNHYIPSNMLCFVGHKNQFQTTPPGPLAGRQKSAAGLWVEVSSLKEIHSDIYHSHFSWKNHFSQIVEWCRDIFNSQLAFCYQREQPL